MVGRKAACLGQRQSHPLKLPTQQAGDMEGLVFDLEESIQQNMATIRDLDQSTSTLEKHCPPPPPPVNQRG